MSHIAVLLSGGVDSASALYKYILENPKKKNHITAYYLKIWLEDEISFLGQCPWEEDIFYARKVAEECDIPFSIISLQHEYYERVVSYTIAELKNGGTPSPDIFCNQYIKFGSFLEKIDAPLIISGHYARVKNSYSTLISPLCCTLHQALDDIKDQTYFLSRLDQTQLSRIFFPIGNLTKQDVRSFAQNKKLAPMNRKDSQGICFLGKIKYKNFVKFYLGEKQGDIIHLATGKKIGTHLGTWFYTIGQRSGLNMGGGPWYVCGKSIRENIVWVRNNNDKECLPTYSIYTDAVHWIHNMFLDNLNSTKTSSHLAFTVQVKLRHGPEIHFAHVTYDIKNKTSIVHLSQGDYGIAPGQFVVFYKDSECLGTARISNVHENPFLVEQHFKELS